LNAALAEFEMRDDFTVEMEVGEVEVPHAERPVRGPRGEDALVFEGPDYGPEQGQVVLLVDEAGAMSWHFPLEDDNTIEPQTVRGGGGRKTFRIRRRIPRPESQGEPETRGLVKSIGRKVLRHLVYPITDGPFGAVGEYFARNWETKRRPYRARLVIPGTHGIPDVPDMTREDWERIVSGRALLLVHGTFSTTHGAFGALPPEVVRDLNEKYEGRVFAFDHHTLSVDPGANVHRFMEIMSDAVPVEARVDLDILCHSRGGLVARTMAERPPFVDIDPGRLSVRRILFVGTPNNGTILTDPNHMVGLLDRISTVLNLFPPSFVSEWMEAVLTVVQMVGHGVLSGLDGLAAQRPNGPFLTSLNAARDAALRREYYGITADFEPAGGLRDLVFDGTMDWVFQGTPNDLVVPTAGVCDGLECPGFPVPADQVLRFEPHSGVVHTNYFEHEDTQARIRSWLRVGD
jgi:hypothetical protein